jgi:hypothetical protein
MAEATWKTKDGTEIPISRMSDIHLLNTEQFLKRRFRQLQNVDPPDFQGEMAQMIADDEWNSIQEADIEDIFPRYADIYAEIQRRGLVTFEQFAAQES